MEIERRQTPRHSFGAVVELFADEPAVHVIAKTTELSRLGCFVGTPRSLPAGTKISLKITYQSREFNASGEVVYELPGKGVGISFAAASHEDEVLLEEWLKQVVIG